MGEPDRTGQAGGTAAATRLVPRRTPDELLADALAIRSLLDDLADDEHRTRAKLLLARDEVRRDAARQWREHGWRPITDEF